MQKKSQKIKLFSEPKKNLRVNLGLVFASQNGGEISRLGKCN